MLRRRGQFDGVADWLRMQPLCLHQPKAYLVCSVFQMAGIGTPALPLARSKSLGFIRRVRKEKGRVRENENIHPAARKKIVGEKFKNMPDNCRNYRTCLMVQESWMYCGWNVKRQASMAWAGSRGSRLPYRFCWETQVPTARQCLRDVSTVHWAMLCSWSAASTVCRSTLWRPICLWSVMHDSNHTVPTVWNIF